MWGWGERMLRSGVSAGDRVEGMATARRDGMEGAAHPILPVCVLGRLAPRQDVRGLWLHVGELRISPGGDVSGAGHGGYFEGSGGEKGDVRGSVYGAGCGGNVRVGVAAGLRRTVSSR